MPLYACFVDIQKAYDTVQHGLLWERLAGLGVQGRMPAAIQSLYASGTLSMKIEGTAGLPQLQRMGVRQGCPLSPILFGLFFDGLHEHLSGLAPAAGLLLRSGRQVPFLCYADDVVLLFDSLGGLQRLIDGMHDFCNSSGLVISVAETEVVGFHGSHVQGNWSLQSDIVPRARSFKYLGLVFHESGGLGPMLRHLHSAGQGARAKLQANFSRLGCSTSLPLLLRLFSTLVTPDLSYGCEV